MQISEEEKKALEDLKIELTDTDKREYFSNWFAKDLDIIVNLIERQQAEYSNLKLKYEQGLLLHKKHISDLEIKDKMIDAMSEEIFIKRAYAITCEEDIQKSKERIKEEYRKKVEEC